MLHVYQLSYSLEQSRFCAAWEKVVARHSILVTRFVTYRSRFFQIVLRESVRWTSMRSLSTCFKADCSHPVRLRDRLVPQTIVTDAGTQERYFIGPHIMPSMISGHVSPFWRR